MLGRLPPGYLSVCFELVKFKKYDIFDNLEFFVATPKNYEAWSKNTGCMAESIDSWALAQDSNFLVLQIVQF